MIGQCDCAQCQSYRGEGTHSPLIKHKYMGKLGIHGCAVTGCGRGPYSSIHQLMTQWERCQEYGHNDIRIYGSRITCSACGAEAKWQRP